MPISFHVKKKKIPFSFSNSSHNFPALSPTQPSPTEPTRYTMIDDLMNSWLDITAGLHRGD